ncbi:MAG: DUF1501 domain-containing protein [Planctomycetes bacterium]|nr:DUF1501 domain-containing protein [Planctomycetota bacterium]MCH9723667.1 DUF1501 domain-containing protein [Planctomycetota bacterium]MCH9778485.1 DUF1501 domain-containing protein [Planctomycetota bacterium]MCH9791565.1 DUF1501 domain-containing protein [Planctomycetota bacterium]
MQHDLHTSLARREFLTSQVMGLGGLAATWLLAQDGYAADPVKPMLERPTFDLTPKLPHVEPSARAMISIFTSGGPSQIDLFDPKPEVDKRNDTEYTGELKLGSNMAARNSRKLLGSKWKFRRYGESGIEMSELLPHIGSVADDITLIRSMQTFNSAHPTAMRAINSGRPRSGRPSLGSWITYALGTENQNLPSFVVLTAEDGLPLDRELNWSNGFIPSIYQGTVIRSREPRILDLNAPLHLRGPAQREWLTFLNQFNREHLKQHPGENDLEARIASYELAARMQVAAKEALDISSESVATKKLYGLDQEETREFGSRCLIARRLVERGVRFVQLHNAYQQWDHHAGIHKRLPEMCRKTDQPSAALVKDLKSRGLLDTTLVHWGGEMGRLPIIEMQKPIGRDHNPYGFSMWLAGGGVKGGHIHGETDELGFKAIHDHVTHFDYHATLLHLFGLDHREVLFERSTRQERLTDGQPAKIVNGILKNPVA